MHTGEKNETRVTSEIDDAQLLHSVSRHGSRALAQDTHSGDRQELQEVRVTPEHELHGDGYGSLLIPIRLDQAVMRLGCLQARVEAEVEDGVAVSPGRVCFPTNLRRGRGRNPSTRSRSESRDIDADCE
jgi:hypothetical protein